MKGHIRERSPGHYAIIIDLRDPTTGERRRKWHSFKGTKRAAQIECARLISELQGGGYIEPAKVTLAQFLERWLSHIKSQVSPRSHERYAEIIHTHIVPLRGAAHQVASGSGIRILQQGAGQRAQGREGRTLATHGSPHPPDSKAGAYSGRALADARPQSGQR